MKFQGKNENVNPAKFSLGHTLFFGLRSSSSSFKGSILYVLNANFVLDMTSVESSSDRTIDVNLY